jgi:hypothetical protein
MMGRLRIAILCSAATFCLASVVQAASLTVTQGEVLFSRGAGYQTINGSVDLLTGDTVLGKPGSAAEIAFADGCTVPLGVGAVFKVGTTSPCQPHSAGPGASGVTETPGDSGWGLGDWQSNPALPYVAVAGIVAVVLATTGHDHGHHSASP